MVGDVTGSGAPTSFDEDNVDEWSLWVLENGLPGLPMAVKKGESVPVARWVGRSVGAVLHVQWMREHYEDDDDLTPSGDDFLASEVTCFTRVDGAWQQGYASGGSGWNSPVLERPASIGPGETRQFGQHGEAGCCWAPYGVTGTDARFIELGTEDHVERVPVESPVGAWIAAWDPISAAELRILGVGEEELYSKSFPPWPT